MSWFLKMYDSKMHGERIKIQKLFTKYIFFPDGTNV